MTHRIFNLALLARRPIVVERPLVAHDTRLFLQALERCGFLVEEGEGEVALEPKSKATSGGRIECGNAGTMFRFLVATLTTVPGEWRVDGTPRLRERPVGRLVEALRGLGARIDCLEREGYAPLRIDGGTLEGGHTRIDAQESSQFLSALLMAGTRARKEVALDVGALASSPYVEITLAAMESFGARVERIDESRYRVEPGRIGCRRARVEGDYSAAAYPAAAAALTGGEVLLEGLAHDSPQGDREFLSLLERMGACLGEDRRGIVVRGGDLEALDADMGGMPDQVPTLAALAPFARGTTRIRNVPQLRIKESDRLRAMAVELGKLGVPVDEEPDGLVIRGCWHDGSPSAERVVVESHDDHRIAMSLALVGLRRPGVVIRNPEVVAKSYPGFWTDFFALVGE